MEKNEILDMFYQLVLEGKWKVEKDGRVYEFWRRRTGWLDVPIEQKKKTSNGYKMVRTTMEIDGIKRVVSVCSHRLVYRVYKGEIPKGMQINHINGIKDDNRIENLEIVTPRQNVIHSIETGLTKFAYGVDSGRGVISDGEVNDIRLVLKYTDISEEEVAEFYGVRVNQINRIKNFKRREKVKMNLKEFQEKSKRTINEELSKEQQLTNMIFGIIGEVGELTDIIKKNKFQGHDLDKDKLTEEIGDVMFYVANLCNVLDFELEELIAKNVLKLIKRYPNGFEKERSINRKG